MRKSIVVTMLFALALLGYVIEGAADTRVGGAGREMHGGRGFTPGTEMRGGGRGFAAGGEIREHGERGELREFREGRHHHRHFEDQGILIYPGPYYYPAYPDYDFQGRDFDPPEQPGYLYMCENPAGYFPNVLQCPEGWEEIPTGEGG